jgi:hypothetical protein
MSYDKSNFNNRIEIKRKKTRKAAQHRRHHRSFRSKVKVKEKRVKIYV